MATAPVAALVAAAPAVPSPPLPLPVSATTPAAAGPIAALSASVGPTQAAVQPRPLPGLTTAGTATAGVPPAAAVLDPPNPVAALVDVKHNRNSNLQIVKSVAVPCKAADVRSQTSLHAKDQLTAASASASHDLDRLLHAWQSQFDALAAAHDVQMRHHREEVARLTRQCGGCGPAGRTCC